MASRFASAGLARLQALAAMAVAATFGVTDAPAQSLADAKQLRRAIEIRELRKAAPAASGETTTQQAEEQPAADSAFVPDLWSLIVRAPQIPVRDATEQSWDVEVNLQYGRYTLVAGSSAIRRREPPSEAGSWGSGPIFLAVEREFSSGTLGIEATSPALSSSIEPRKPAIAVYGSTSWEHDGAFALQSSRASAKWIRDGNHAPGEASTALRLSLDAEFSAFGLLLTPEVSRSFASGANRKAVLAFDITRDLSARSSLSITLERTASRQDSDLVALASYTHRFGGAKSAKPMRPPARAR
jgi:hypothetical protein